MSAVLWESRTGWRASTGPDYRAPVADRLYLPTADGGRAITDAVAETYHLVNAGRGLRGGPPIHPKNGARFHFELPGPVQGFKVDDSPGARGAATLENVEGIAPRVATAWPSNIRRGKSRTAREGTPTFLTSREVAEYVKHPAMPCSLLRHPLGTDSSRRGTVWYDQSQPLRANLYLHIYRRPRCSTGDRALPGSRPIRRAAAHYRPGAYPTTGAPSPRLGSRSAATNRLPAHSISTTSPGRVRQTLCSHVLLATRRSTVEPRWTTRMWRRAWVNGMDSYLPYWPEPFGWCRTKAAAC